MSDNFENQENEELNSEENEEMVSETVADESADDVSNDGYEDEASYDEDEDTSLTEETSYGEYGGEYTGPGEMADVPVRSGKKLLIIGIISVVAAALIGTGVYFYVNIRNAPYNYLGYINVSGETIGNIAEYYGSSLDEFLEMHGLPADMPADTDETAAYNTIPTGVIAGLYGMDVETLKKEYEIPDTVGKIPMRMKIVDLISPKFNVGDTINEDTPWGIAEGEATLRGYMGTDDEEALEEVKSMYGLDDSVTFDTQWKDIRDIVEKQQLEQRKKAEEEAQNGEADDDLIDVVPSEDDTSADVPNAENAGEAEAAADAQSNEQPQTAGEEQTVSAE